VQYLALKNDLIAKATGNAQIIAVVQCMYQKHLHGTEYQPLGLHNWKYFVSNSYLSHATTMIL